MSAFLVATHPPGGFSGGPPIYTAFRIASKAGGRAVARDRGGKRKKEVASSSCPPDEPSGSPFPGVSASSLQTDAACDREESGPESRNPFSGTLYQHQLCEHWTEPLRPFSSTNCVHARILTQTLSYRFRHIRINPA